MKRIIQSVLNKFGYELRKKQTEGSGSGYTSSYLARICHPSTVFDVGVGFGTYQLYEAFPQAKFILIEPLTEYKTALDTIAGQYDCTIFYKAVSDKPGTQEFIVDHANPQRSSFSGRTVLTATGDPLTKRMVEVSTLDHIFHSIPAAKKPILLKLDTEGHELNALQGATSLLEATEMVIAEVSIAKRFEYGYTFSDLILFMKEKGFELYSLLNITHPPGELTPRFADVVFTRPNKSSGR